MSQNEIRKICIYGIGGVGGYFGGMMAGKINETNSSTEIYFIARGAHLEEIKRNGLKLSFEGKNEMICRPTLAVQGMSEIPEPQVIFLCVKSYDLEQVLEDLSGVVKENTMIVPLLNGVDIYERIRSKIKIGMVFPACVYVASHIEGPGIVKQDDARYGTIHLGKDPMHPDVVPQNILNMLNEMGIAYTWYENSFPAIWEKYLFVGSFAMATARFHKSFREVVADDKSRQFVQEILQEVVDIAKCEGVEWKEDIIGKFLKRAEGMNADSRSSFQRDIERGKLKNEIDIFGFTLLRLGKKYGVGTKAIQIAVDEIQQELKRGVWDE